MGNETFYEDGLMVIYLCIHFLLAPVEGLSYKPKYRANIFYTIFILILFPALLLAVSWISLLFIN